MSLRPPIVVVTLVIAAAALATAADARATAVCPQVAGRADAPSPALTLGRPLAARDPSPSDTTRVLTAIDRSSPRVVVRRAGRSARGRPLSYALVGAPPTLRAASLARIEQRLRAVRNGRVGPVSSARAASGPAVVWLGGGVHANEPSGTVALLDLVHRLATDDSCGTRRILHETLTVVVPDQNPDGHVLGTRTDADGFDLNRDWFAAARPETRARLALLRRYPPTVAIDLHEQTGRGYFVPPYAPPIVPGLPAATRRFADATVAPAVGRALRGVGAAVGSGAGYDLLYPGYADSAISLLLGAGGMTFEQGSDLPLAVKSAHHALAVRTALQTVAAHRRTAIEAWTDGFRVALAAGARRRTVTGRPVSAWILRTETRAADARALASRLRAVSLRVRVLRRAVALDYRPLGTSHTTRTTLPAGTIVVPVHQAQQRWADVLLGRALRDGRGNDDGWSLPRLVGIDAGLALSPIPDAAMRALDAEPKARPRAGRRFAFPGDSAAAAAVVSGLLAGGVEVGLDAAGRFVTAATGDAAGRLRRARLSVATTPAGAAPPTALRPPSVTVIADDGPPSTGAPAQQPRGGDRPSAWIPAMLREASAATVVAPAATVALGVRPGTTHVIVGPGTIGTPTDLTALAASLDRFVRDGGRVIAIGREGLATLAALGLGVNADAPTETGATTTVAAVPVGDRGRLLGGPTRVVLQDAGRLEPDAGTEVLLRTAGPSPLGPTASPLAVSTRRGHGDVVSLGFSPAFRGQSEGGRRILLGLLLGEPEGPSRAPSGSR